MSFMELFFDNLPSPFFHYCTVHEIKIRLKSSLLLWCYYGCIFLILLPSFLYFIFSYSFSPVSSKLLGLLLFLFLLFFPINLDLFSRERQVSMLDYLVISPTQFKTLYFARSFANAILMILPPLGGFLGVFLIEKLSGNRLSPLFFSPFFLLLLFLFFFDWFLISVLTLGVSENYYPSSIFRTIIYYLTILTVFFVLLILDLYDFQFLISPVLLGRSLFADFPLSFLVLLILSFILLFSVYKVITHICQKTVIEVMKGGQQMKSGNFHTSSNFYLKLLNLTSTQTPTWQQSLLLLNCLPYVLVYILFDDSFSSIMFVVYLFCIHFITILLIGLFTIFPKIVMEKEYNMEEMILARISAYRYFSLKVTSLLRPILLNFLFSFGALVIFFRSETSTFFPLAVNLLFRAIYFVAVLLLIWRIFPVKNLLQSTVLSIFGIEIVGILVSIFLFPGVDYLLILFSPILSSLLLAAYISTPDAQEVISFSLQANIVLAITFYLASLVLTKSEISYS